MLRKRYQKFNYNFNEEHALHHKAKRCDTDVVSDCESFNSILTKLCKDAHDEKVKD